MKDTSSVESLLQIAGVKVSRETLKVQEVKRVLGMKLEVADKEVEEAQKHWKECVGRQDALRKLVKKDLSPSVIMDILRERSEEEKVGSLLGDDVNMGEE